MWHEGIGQHGSCEIGTCVQDYLSSEAEKGVKKVVLSSDNCSGQNRNKFIACMYIKAMHKYKFDKLEHCSLEAGHTQNENDSVHSLIERKQNM